jgi:hypothetical protein
VPQSTAAVGFILARTLGPDGQRRPFRLQFGFSPSFPNAYALLARYVYGAPFLASPNAADVFRVEARPPDPSLRADADTLVLSTVVVRHGRPVAKR